MDQPQPRPRRRAIYRDRVKMSVYWSRSEYEQIREHADRGAVPICQIVRAAVFRQLKIKEVRP